MRAVIQKVKEANVKVNEEIIGKIGKGLVILLGMGKGDTQKDVECLAEKIINLRIFEDTTQKMNLSLLEINGEILVVSQFTLYGNLKKGRRPSFEETLSPDLAKNLYQQFIAELKKNGIKAQEGSFQAKMMVEILNDGPVTFVLETKDGKISQTD